MERLTIVEVDTNFTDTSHWPAAMGNAAGVRRDFAGLERRRLAVAELLKQGVSQSEVARRLGVHRHLPSEIDLTVPSVNDNSELEAAGR